MTIRSVCISLKRNKEGEEEEESVIYFCELNPV